MAAIVTESRPLKGLEKQRGYASQTLALLNKDPLLFMEEPERGIFIHWLHVTVAFSCLDLVSLFVHMLAFFFDSTVL